MSRWVKRGSAQLPTSCRLPQAFGLWSPGRGFMDGVTTTKTVVFLKLKARTLRCFVVNLATGIDMDPQDLEGEDTHPREHGTPKWGFKLA